MKKFLLLLILSSFIFFPVITRAVTTAELGIMPGHPDPKVKYSDSWFFFNADKGETKEDGVLLYNNSGEIVTVKIYPVDATVTTDGGFAPLEEGAPRLGVGAWIKLSQEIVDLPPNSKTEVPFTITIPKETDVGDHVGAIILEKIQREKAKLGSTGVEIVNRLGVRVFETVPGEIIRSLKITAFDWDITEKEFPYEAKFKDKLIYHIKKIIGLDRKINFMVALENDGNVRLEPMGTMEVKNIWGKKIGIIDETKSGANLAKIPFGMIIPHKSTKIPIIWQKNAPIFDRLKVNLEIPYGDNKTATASLVIWIIPYTLLAILGVLVFLIVLIYYLWRLMVYKQREKMLHYRVQKGENLLMIANKFKKNWRVIAKINKLKPPYAVKEGQILLIPHKRLFRYIISSIFGSVKFWVILLVIFGLGFGSEVYFINKEMKKREPVGQVRGESIQFGVPKEKALQEAIKRDDKRKIDLAILQNALEKYYKDFSKYPVSEIVTKTYDKDNVLKKNLVDNGYLDNLPLDPTNPTYYYGYKTDSEGKSYELTAVLENPDDNQGQDIGKFLIYKVISGKN